MTRLLPLLTAALLTATAATAQTAATAPATPAEETAPAAQDAPVKLTPPAEDPAASAEATDSATTVASPAGAAKAADPSNAADAAVQPAAAAVPPNAILPPPGLAELTAQTEPKPLTPEQVAIVRRVNNYFNTLSDLTGDFMQINPNGQQVTGKFYLSRPGKVRFDYDKPSPLQLISDGTTVAVRDRKSNTQDLYYLAQTPLQIILAEKVNLLKNAKVIAVTQQLDLTTVVIEEKSIAGTGRLSVVFEGPGLKLRQWTVTDAQGLNTTVAIQSMKKAESKLDAKIFKIRFQS